MSAMIHAGHLKTLTGKIRCDETKSAVGLDERESIDVPEQCKTFEAELQSQGLEPVDFKLQAKASAHAHVHALVPERPTMYGLSSDSATKYTLDSTSRP